MKYTYEVLEEVAPQCRSVREVVYRISGSTTSNSTLSLVRKKLDEYQIDTSHFTGQGWAKGREARNKKSASEHLRILPEGSCRLRAGLLRRCMLECGRKEICSVCEANSWRGKPLRLQVHHVNGNPLDNRIENLEFVCPNCHSQLG